MICSLGTQQERQIFGGQSKIMMDTSRRSYGRRYTSKVWSHYEKTGYMINTCYRKHGFPSQFKFKIRKQTVIITSRIMKVQGQKCILCKLVLLLSNNKHYKPFYNSLNPLTMLLIRSLSFLPTQQHTLGINFSLSLVLRFLILVQLIIFVHPWLISLHIIKLILSLSNYQMEIKSLQIILEVFLLIKIMS